MKTKCVQQLGNPHLWIIFIIFIVCVLLHYPGVFSQLPQFEVVTLLGLERHALIRILFIVPIAYGAFKFGVTGGVLTLVTASLAMLPRVIWISRYPRDALFETVTTVIIGTLIVIWFSARQKTLLLKEETIEKLEGMETELRRVGERFQEIFEKANDAIWLQDMAGNIFLANEACQTVTGYGKNELLTGNAYSLLLSGQAESIKQTEMLLLERKNPKQPYEQLIRKKDGTGAAVMITSSLLGNEQSPVFLHIGRDITEERNLQQSLKEYAKQIGKAHEEERKRIARELHDDTIQTLVGISRILDNLITKQENLSKETFSALTSVREQTDEALRRTRSFVQNLRPPILEYLGLIPALRELADGMREQSGIEIRFETSGDDEAYSADDQLLVYRVAQEALWNAVKYSEATSIGLKVDISKGELNLRVTDNGKGFMQENDIQLLEEGKLGLIGMKERAELLKGDLNIVSQPGKGTRVSLSVLYD